MEMKENESEKIRKEFFFSRIPVYRNDPVLFAKEVVGFEPDWWQVMALKHLVSDSRVAIKSGQGVGKTGMESIAVIWFLTCHYDARVVATAPTRQQLHDVLWSEISKWMDKSPLLKEILQWTKTYVYVNGRRERWFAVARTATKPENMQGFHEDNMLFIVDEASGIAEPIMEAVLGTLTGANNKLLMCGNPTKTSGTFHDAFYQDQKLYYNITVSSRDSRRTNKDNIASLERKYGKNSNVVRVRVDGEFPLEDDDVFIPYEWLGQSTKTEMQDGTIKALKERDGKELWRVDIGCDVARFGDDKTVITSVMNEVVKIEKKYNGKDTTWTAAEIVNLYRKIRKEYQYTGTVNIKIDDGGVGGGVVDQLKRLKKSNENEYKNLEIIPVHFGQKIKHKFYDDTTTFMMSIVRDLIAPFDRDGKPHKCELILPDDADLMGQLSCRKYEFLPNTKQRVESKKDMKERGLSSPDEADSVLLACLPVKKRRR